jgi:amino acid adenylation domain-containing protein
MDLSFNTLKVGLAQSFQIHEDRNALVTVEGTFTYGEVAEGSYKVCRALNGASSRFIPVFAYRSRSAYQALFGVLLSGRAYAPLNPRFPAKRTLAMIEKIGADYLILASECIDIFSNFAESIYPITVICMDTPDAYADLIRKNTKHRFIFADFDEPKSEIKSSVNPNPNDPAYLLFTSGSTGIPKGVAVSNSNVCAYLKTVIGRYQVTSEDRVSQMFDLTFDLSVHDIFISILTGACLYVVPESNLFAPSRFIANYKLTLWFSVPSVVMFMKKMRMLKPDSFPSLRVSLFCGEALPVMSAQSWQDAAPNSILENLYGPTEATIAITHFTWNPSSSPSKSVNGVVPIGTPFANQEILILKENNQIAMENELGELLLSGSQVTNGYYLAPEITNEKYVQIPSAGDRTWYKTGDLVKLDLDGDLCYFGRIDDQVQVRGHRVELQEIDRIIRLASGLDLALALPLIGDSGTVEKIIAFLQSKKDLTIYNNIMAECKQALPEYMIPADICFLSEFPLNANGKIDRNKIIQSYASKEIK